MKDNKQIEFKNYQRPMGVDWSKDNIYEAIGRPDLRPTKKTALIYRVEQIIDDLKDVLDDLHDKEIRVGDEDDGGY